jgi:hypothetical protein
LVRVLGVACAQFATVYRGVRGELPEAFWLRDAFGMVTATDFGFMSTSLDRVVSEGFLGSGGVCVLWEIECGAERGDGRRLPQRGGRQAAVAVPARARRRCCSRR